MDIGLGFCSGFGWDGVNFLHSSSYGGKFWICDQNNVDNTLMFLPLLNPVKAFSVSHAAPPASRLGVDKK